MDLNKNYYNILSLEKDSTSDQVKKAYYKLSFKYHPDKGGDPIVFAEITEAYDILMSEKNRSEYDTKSRYGSKYSAVEEFYNLNYEYNYQNDLKKRDDFKSKEVLHVYIQVDDTFNGEVEYPRWITCKSCAGTGQDLKGKIVIRDERGNIKGTFESEEGCDFCEGSGTDWKGGKCGFCHGEGKVGLKSCDTCGGSRRTLGKQKLKNIQLDGDETIVESMGHVHPIEKGRCGHLILKKKLDS